MQMRMDLKTMTNQPLYKQSQMPHYFNGFLKPTESGPNGISGMAPKLSRFYSLSRSYREYIESQSWWEITTETWERGKPRLSCRPEYHQKPISKQLVHLRVRIPDPGSIKRLREEFDFGLMLFDNQKTAADKWQRPSRQPEKQTHWECPCIRMIVPAPHLVDRRWTLMRRSPGQKVTSRGTIGPSSPGKKGESPRLPREGK